MTNSTFTNNIASVSGGAMYNDYSDDAVLDNLVFQENEANYGGAMY